MSGVIVAASSRFGTIPCADERRGGALPETLPETLRVLWKALSVVLVLFVTGCQSLSLPPPTVGTESAGTEAVSPAYADQFEQIEGALSELNSAGLPADQDTYARQAQQLSAVSDDFLRLVNAGPATAPEFRLWGDYFNRLSDTVEVVVAGDANLAEAERLYEQAARLYPQFLERSQLPGRPYRAVDGETSAYFAGNYFLCTMPEVIADGYGRRGLGGMSGHLEQAMRRYLSGPCEPDLMFSAAEMLYDYALISGPNRSAYRTRIEHVGPGKSAPWLVLLDNLLSDYDRAQALARLDQVLAEARANLDDDEVISAEFASEVERQRTLLLDGQAPIRTLRYRP
ncbi:hypothetical protein [Marinobacter alexandrii]|uniref:hypothetical protein n=2 Tax=Marinobacter alexandrii TaxID=2570351 RepID=UPI003266D399